MTEASSRIPHDAAAAQGGKLRYGAALAAILFLAALVRLTTWQQVFTADGIRFAGDDDTYYHVLRAQDIANEYPHVRWYDRQMNYPDGAVIFWPPLFDLILATAAVVAAGGHPQPDAVARAAAFVPPVLGVATLPILAAIGRRLWGESAGLLAALFVALLPAHAELSVLGRPDQHVAELFFFSLILLACLGSWRKGGGASFAANVMLLGAAVCCAFWNWMGSALYLVFLLSVALAWHLCAPPAERNDVPVAGSLALGFSLGAALLAASVLLFGEPGALRRMQVGGVGGLHVALTAAAGLGAGGLWAAPLLARHGRGRAIGSLVVLAAAFIALLAAAPELRQGIRVGLEPLLRGTPWFKNSQEFDPLFFSGVSPLSEELRSAARMYGFLPLVAPFALRPLLTAWKQDPAARPQVLFLFLFGGCFFVLALARLRFAAYFVVPLALWAAIAVPRISTVIASRIRSLRIRAIVPGMVCGVVLAPACFGMLAEPLAARDAAQGELIKTLTWLRGQPQAAGREGVMAEWSYGHAIRYFAEKPVLVNPFGPELGLAALRDSAAFFLADDPLAAEKVLHERRLGFVVLTNPLTEAYYARAYAGEGASPAVSVSHDPLRGIRAEPTDAFWKLVVARLYFLDGARPDAVDFLDGYRLLYESDMPSYWGAFATKKFKVFGMVPGARVAIVTAPGSGIAASINVETNQGRAFLWRAGARADGRGSAVLRIPYATGVNGAVRAGPLRVTIGNKERIVNVAAGQVEQGLSLQVRAR